MCRPTMFFGNMDTLDHLGLIFALLSAIMHSFAFITTKRLSNVHFLYVTLFEYVLHFVCALILVLTIDNDSLPTNKKPYVMVALAAISLFFTTTTQVLALYYGSAAVVSITKNVNVPTLFLMQCIIQKQVPYYLSIIGSFLLFIGVLIINIRVKINRMLEKFKYLFVKTADYNNLSEKDKENNREE